MMARTSLQEDFGAYRFQLAYMAYALALAHIHRLPAAPGLFRAPFAQLIEKLKSPDVWSYWHFASVGAGPFSHGHAQGQPQWDPIIRDNIMYSAYLQSTSLLYHYLFNDGRYAEPGALTLSFKPAFWGPEKRFVYDERSLNEHIYWLMVERGYLGVACEPNCVFQVCNQVPILGFRLHDLVYGGDLAGEVTQGYLKAWEQFGVVNARGHFNVLVLEHERTLVSPESPWSDFWLGALMHSWNPATVQANYPAQIARWRARAPDGSMFIDVNPNVVRNPERASARDFGWAAVCASEVGDTETLEGLLHYADQHLNPVRRGGAYYYPRNDLLFDDAGYFRAMDPHTGNALLAYARLNIAGGLQKLYAGAWPPTHFADPALDQVSDAVDVLFAHYSAVQGTLRLRIAPSEPAALGCRMRISNVAADRSWRLIADGETLAVVVGSKVSCATGRAHIAFEGTALSIEMPLDGELKLDLHRA